MTAIIKKKETTTCLHQKIINVHGNIDELEPLHTAGESCTILQLRWKTVQLFPKIFNVELSNDPVIPILDIYPKELKAETRQIFLHSRS